MFRLSVITQYMFRGSGRVNTRLQTDIRRRVERLRARSVTIRPDAPSISPKQLLQRVDAGLKRSLRLYYSGHPPVYPVSVHTTYDPRVIRAIIRDVSELQLLGIDIDFTHTSGGIPNSISLVVRRPKI